MTDDLYLRCGGANDLSGDAVISITAILTATDTTTAGAVLVASTNANFDVSRERPRRTPASITSRDLRARQLLHARRP